MGGRAAIGVDDDLPAGKPGVAVRPADHELAGRVDVPDGLGVDPVLGERRVDDRRDDLLHVVGGDGWPFRASTCWVETTIEVTPTGLP